MTDLDFIKFAIEEALKASEKEEVPVGAVIVLDGKVIARAHNQKESLPDATAHAELIAIKEACRKINNWRLEEATIYVTKEPCIMCAGAILNARIKRLVYGCDDPKGGAVKSLYNVLNDQRLNHQVEVIGGVMEEECKRILKDFFKKLRKNDF
ncbi:MAG: tRNA adenosine(34) deaminase TadA [Thermodesulfovibrionales bacterium]|nr:tRNA adenosine(34) deaminase TadA [Thermodesulfovibrionales bacterium]